MTTKLWNNDNELFSLVREELFVAVVGDVMDNLGLLHQFLPPKIRALDAKMVTVGRAMPVLEADFFEEVSSGQARGAQGGAFGLLFDALDDLKRNEVYVCTGGSPRYALWGGLMTTRAQVLGAVGVVADGYIRDTHEIFELGFSTFAYGSFAQDQGSRGKVVDFRVPIEIQGIRIRPGDLIFGDVDGVCVIPQEAEEDVFRAALEKARGEQTVRKAIEGGMSAREAYDKYGIL